MIIIFAIFLSVSAVWGGVGLPFVIYNQVFGCNDSKLGHITKIEQNDIFRCDVYIDDTTVIKNMECDIIPKYMTTDRVRVGFNHYYESGCKEILHYDYTFKYRFNEVYIIVVLFSWLVFLCLKLDDMYYDYKTKKEYKKIIGLRKKQEDDVLEQT